MGFAMKQGLKLGIGLTLAALLAGAQPLWADSGIEAITRPSKDVTLSFVRPGQVEKILAAEGDAIKPAQVLVQLDDAAERAVMEQLKAQAQDDIRVRAAEAQLAQKKVDLKRMELAHKKDVATDLEVEHARLDVTISDLSLALSRFEHKQNRRKYEEAQIQVRRMRLSCPPANRGQNKKDPRPTYKVEKIFVQCGESVDRLQEVIRIVKIDPLWIDVPVPLTQVRAMQLNVTHVAHVRFPDAPDRPVTCKVTHIAAVADAASATLTVRLEVPNPSGRPAGEQVTVQFDASKRPASPAKTKSQARPGTLGAPLTKTAATETTKG